MLGCGTQAPTGWLKRNRERGGWKRDRYITIQDEHQHFYCNEIYWVKNSVLKMAVNLR